VDDCVDERVLGTGAVHTHHVEDLALSTAKYANASVTLPKLSTGLFIPKVEAMSSFTVGDWVAGATTPGYTPTVNAVAIVTAGFYDLEALYPGRFHATLQYKIGNGAWTGMNPAVVSDVSGSDLGVQFTYPIYITAGQTIYFRALGQAAVTAQWSTSSYIFGFLLPR
jgi:hypothetical protein